MNEITQNLLQRVEELSGKPVVVQADARISWASIVMARGSAPAHVVVFNPSLEAAADYAIAYQCGYALRIYMAPATERFDMQCSVRGIRDVETLLIQHAQKSKISLPADLLTQFREKFGNGLVTQLRSQPTGLRVDAWLMREFPALVEQQRMAVNRQLNSNAKSLGPEVRKLAPHKVIQASLAMNSAFAAFWSRAWSDPLLLVPYKTSANLAAGEALLRIWDEIPDEPANDKRLVQAWGEHLKLGGWYEFLPYQ